MQKILLAIAVFAGLLFAYVDSRPTWDDTIVTIFAILFTSGVIALVGFKRPWLLALAVGVWLPIYEISSTRSYASLAAIVVAFIGAYSGCVIRKGLRKARGTML